MERCQPYDREEALSSFGQQLERYRTRVPVSRHALGGQVGIAPSYISRIESGDRPPPRVDKVDVLTRGLNLNGTEEIEFYLAAGYAPPSIRRAYPWMEALAAELEVFNSGSITFSSKGEYSNLVINISENWLEESPEDTTMLLSPPLFRDVFAGFRRRMNKPRNSLAYEIGIDPSYLTRIEHGDKEPPGRDKVEAMIRPLSLQRVDAIRLLVAAGYAPEEFIRAYPWMRAVEATVRLFNKNSISMHSKDEFANVIAAVSANRLGTVRL